jgi:yeast amino acid transporter
VFHLLDLTVCTSRYISDKDWREAGFKTFLDGGASGYLAGFWACFCQAAFAYTGTEIIGITASEAESPRRTLSKAVRRISWRLSIYYVGAAFVLGLNLSPNDPQLEWYLANSQGSYQGPFVLMAQRSGVPGLDHVLNAVCLIAASSVANANLYETV